MVKKQKIISNLNNSVNIELAIRYIDVSFLKEYKRNVKIHSEKQIAKLLQSMSTYGVVTPILVDKNYELIAGHGRLEALKQLGYQKIPIIMLEHLTEAQIKAYRLADNRIADEAEYNIDLLKIELQELVTCDDFVITDTGFDIAEIDNIIIDDYSEKKENTDEADEIDNLKNIEKRVHFGDIWKAGEHFVLCGDALKSESYEALLGEEKASLILVDPPYNVRITGHVCGKGKTKHKEFTMASGEMSDEEFENFVSTFIIQLVKFSYDGSLAYIFTDWRGLQIFLNIGKKLYNDLKNICIWNKLTGGMGSFYRSQYEAVCVFKKGTSSHINNVELGKNGRYRTNIWNHRGVSATNPKSLELLKFHPTVKPIGLLHEILLDASAPQNIVLDCFGGSGSTLLACERAKRKARLIEIDPHYCNIILHRWENITGKKAEYVRNIGDFNNDRQE